MERLFLVRKPRNVIEGPFKKSEILDLLESGVLSGSDEISASGAYWFSCAEGNEIEKWVGVFEQAKTVVEADEMTLTMSGHIAKGDSQSQNEEDEITDPYLDETLKKLSSKSQNQTASTPSSSMKQPIENSKQNPSSTYKRVDHFKVEETSYWKWALIALVPVVLLVVYKILTLARFFE